MSAILSADDLNDFISPGVACIKPVETLPLQQPPSNPYEVVREDQIVENKPAQISLTDCLACSGCVTSAEAILVSLQSHAEVISTLDATPGITIDASGHCDVPSSQSKLFVASVSPQVRASLAATYGVSERQAGYMIEQFLSGPNGLRSGGKFNNDFTWVFDTNSMRQVSLVFGADEVLKKSETPNVKRPVLGSACPGWICYAEKTHPHVLPHLSQLKSPQALAGTFLKSVLSKSLGISPHQIWHLAIMPCFDKKLEAARLELTDHTWKDGLDSTTTPIRDVDCVITAREILMMAESREVAFPMLPKTALPSPIPFPEADLGNFFKPTSYSSALTQKSSDEGTSGGYLWHILKTVHAQNPGSKILSTKGRNADVVDFSVIHNDKTLFKASRNYGFRNIQNLVRKLRPTRGIRGAVRRPNAPAESEVESSYIEVMACPGGCTNGGGQIKLSDLSELQSTRMALDNPKEWQALIDEAYYSMDSSDEELERKREMASADQDDIVNGISISSVYNFVQRWIDFTGISREKLLHTTYRAVESDVGKDKQPDTERVAELASKIGGGW